MKVKVSPKCRRPVCFPSNTFLCLSLQIAELVATEFFEQGDKEREELNIEPIVSSLPAHYITLCEQ